MCSPGTTEDFAVALRRCMSGEAAAPGGVGAGADTGGAGTETKRKLIQGEEGGDRRKAFGQVENRMCSLTLECHYRMCSLTLECVLLP